MVLQYLEEAQSKPHSENFLLTYQKEKRKIVGYYFTLLLRPLSFRLYYFTTLKENTVCFS